MTWTVRRQQRLKLKLEAVRADRRPQLETKRRRAGFDGAALAGVVKDLAAAPVKLNSSAAASYARMASSAVSNVPSQTLLFLPGSRISAAYLPHGRFLTPLKRTSSAAILSAIEKQSVSKSSGGFQMNMM
uniref:Uncharacterized protein n=1 Tax=Kalanchoe fedtschenkoi TaxID=63787 RepID=A0A7N0V0T0_KALFE